MTDVPAVETVRITKTYPGVTALDGVSIQIRAGECHALMGENGAGKSTLGKVLSGLIQPDSGEIHLFGETVHFTGPLAASHAGISIVHQELVFCENLSVEENLSLGAMPSKGPFLDRARLRKRAVEWLERVNADVDPGELVGNLPLGKQQLVQIAGALGVGAKVVIFDEPTSSLTLPESDRLFEQIRDLKKQGVTCVYVSHRMEEIFALCDVVSVLRDGRHVTTRPISELDRNELVRLMVGRDIPSSASQTTAVGEVMLEVHGLTSPGKFRDVSFDLHAGEIVGLAGLVGSGRTEIAEALFGILPATSGSVMVKGRDVRPESPSQMMAQGVGLVPEDRKRLGLILTMNARENISLPTLDQVAPAGFVSAAREREVAQRYFDLLNVRAPSTEAPSVGLSGGNQQKLVLAKWLAAHCDVLILDEPTRGVDVGAKAEIYEHIRELARQGKAILVISSELQEVILLSTRILAVRQGSIAGDVLGSLATEEGLLRMMTGVA